MASTRIPAVVLHIPHASTTIPSHERASLALSDGELALELLRMTDRYTDELFALPEDEATPIAFPVSRLVLDPERFADDAEEPMSGHGMGVIYTRTSHRQVFRNAPSTVERERLLTRYYHPHHDRLTAAVNEALDAHSTCLLIDCHSFPAAALPYELDQSGGRPDICIGTDSFHTPPGLRDAAVRLFEGAGFTVAVDRPFAGALVPSRHYRHDARVRALMIEVNRGLYMSETTGDRVPGFTHLSGRVQDVVRQLVSETTAFWTG
jgi:N-formylglutamate amidohydrolase